MQRSLIRNSLLVFALCFNCSSLFAKNNIPGDTNLVAKQQRISDKRFLVPATWAPLRPILIARVDQKHRKMNLTAAEAQKIVVFLDGLSDPTPNLLHLQTLLPKTTVELIRSVSSRNVTLAEAEKMAEYLDKVVKDFDFKNLPPFDENNSHIIGREWSEIDYSGEGMTWQKQREQYLPFGINNFKSVEVLEKFFAVESKLPYFQNLYKPRNPKGPFI